MNKTRDNLKSYVSIHKWKLCWFFYFFFMVIIILLCFQSQAVHYMIDPIAIQMIVLFFSIAALLLIMLQNNEHLQKLTSKQIEAINDGTAKQINSLRDLTNAQIGAFKESTEKQISAIQKSTKTQIEAVQGFTRDQIEVIQDSTNKQIAVITDLTQRQIQTFIEQCQAIIARLENIAGILATMSEQKQQELQTEKEKVQKEEEKLKNEQIEKQQKAQEKLSLIQRQKPIIFTRTDTQKHYLLWTHHWIYILNTGGISRNLRVECFFLNTQTGDWTKITQFFEDIKGNQQRSFDCGDIAPFKSYNAIKVKISIRDAEEREYIGEIDFNKFDSQWHQIPLV